ncbi:required for meiotic nuclear division protein 1 homolog [Toxorhynchites rutilus septentrionalis]|uniref:required for meiotic nuclear division protein 1 homolog n=1 Tax=Toxorhynchites rutilus septentrionalis TaxID=329112 RepID=UPI002479EFE8|nr:required for meiotic nuclear division protein 1 homolog [Toxorhynchites rutilus septentrionalis]
MLLRKIRVFVNTVPSFQLPRNNTNILTFRNHGSVLWHNNGISSTFSLPLNRAKNEVLVGKRVQQISSSSSFNLHENMQSKKRPRKKQDETLKLENGYLTVTAFATAEEYDLERILRALRNENLYEPKQFLANEKNEPNPDVLHVVAKYKVGNNSRDVYFFREGTVVLWNCTDLESSNILRFLKPYEQDAYDKFAVLEESETMFYNASDTVARLQEDSFYISKNDEGGLEKYTFSNAMSLSVKLGIWEASLERYIESMAYVTDDLKNGSKIKISRSKMLQKTGELFALRHLINLSSDLLDVPDFYWDREQLENLYQQTCSYFSINRRTRVMNEKLNHCVELAHLISSNLNDAHHVRLEWMIIILIMVEVGFEILHYADKFL